jgi:hypothetical protein
MRFLPKRARRLAREPAGTQEPAPRLPPRRVREDLEERGVAMAFSGPVAERLSTRVEGLTEAQYAALLDGVAAAYGVHRQEGRSAQPAPLEMQRLIQDFAVELKKLDEGLRLLSTYLLRIRDRTSGDSSQVMH